MPGIPDRSRRNFLRGQPVSTAAAPRPPGIISESHFLDSCTQCGDCVKACPEQILVIGDGSYPQVNFNSGECTFCGECANHCDHAALQSGRVGTWSLRLEFGVNCLAKKNIVCQSCRDACQERAIRFPPVLNAVATPDWIADDCTGCGACVSACPSSAVSAYG